MTTELAVIREEMDRQAYQATEKLEHAQVAATVCPDTAFLS